MSSQNDPFKSWKLLVLPTIKTSDAFSYLVKATIAVCTLATTSLLFYLAFLYRSESLSCPECDRIFQISGHQRYAAADTVSTIQYQKTNVSHILFGISGTAKRWDERRHYCELWWRPNVTRGFVWLDENPMENQTWPKTSPPYKVSADTSKFAYTCWYGSRSAIRIARIVKESFELGLPNVRWFVMGDDDTVFFLENLVNVLAKYDHNELYYIGGNSESIEQDVIHSYNMGYGGGGFAISYPLAAELVRVLDGCINRYAEFYGSDQKIGGCLSELGVSLTREPGFHQLDLRGNPYGFLAAHPLAPLVSLHHLDYVESIFPNMTRVESLKKLRTAYEMDPDRTLQHSYCYDMKQNRSVSVSWGYSVQVYPRLLRAKDLGTALQTFKSWRSWSDGPFSFNTRALSPDPCERPIVYFLDRVVKVGKGQTLTTYARYVEEGLQLCDRPHYVAALAVPSFNVSAPTFNHELWKKAPRRQCCEVVDGADGADRTMRVKIRACRAFESVSPP